MSVDPSTLHVEAAPVTLDVDDEVALQKWRDGLKRRLAAPVTLSPLEKIAQEFREVQELADEFDFALRDCRETGDEIVARLSMLDDAIADLTDNTAP